MASPRETLGALLEEEASFIRDKLSSGEIPNPAQLGDFLRSLTTKSGPMMRDAPQLVATTLRDSLNRCGWDVGANQSVGDDPPDPNHVLRALEDTLAALRDDGGRKRSPPRDGRRDRSPRDGGGGGSGGRRDRSPGRRRSRSRSRSRGRGRRRRSRSSSSSRSRSPPKKPERRSGFSAQPPPGAAPELVAQAAMLQAMAGQGGISGGGMGVNPMMAMMGGIPGMQGAGDKKMRELYVGNVPVGVTSEQLKEVLGGALQQVGLNEMAGNPIVACFMSGNFGFAEFRTPGEANNGMNLDKIFIGNAHLNVGRPSKYMGPVTAYVTWGEFVTNLLATKPELTGKVIGMPAVDVTMQIDYSTGMTTAAAGAHKAVGEQATKALRELFVSLPAGCTETDLSNYLTSQCHELGLCQMDMNPVLSARVNTLKAFAFCEFASVEICDGVFDKLNNAEMGGGNLRFGRPKAYEQLQLAGQLPSQGGGAAIGGDQPPPQAPLRLEAPPTLCLRMTNMLNEEILKDDEEYSDIKEDIQEELANYGEVLGVEMPRSGVGFLHAFVKFSTVEGAKAAKAVVEKRSFDGKQIGVEYFNVDKFDAKNWGVM